MRTPADIANLLGLPYSTLTYLAYATQHRAYASFLIPKRRGGHRTIQAPVSALKAVQRRLADVLNTVYDPPQAVHGFTGARNIKSNAHPHVRRTWVLNVDLKDFFPEINFGRVRGLFQRWPYNLPANVATVLAQICCHNDELPQGAPTSPIVSNMVCARMDSQLQGIARRFRCTYTRYADDITFSHSLSQFPAALATKSPLGVTTVGTLLERVLWDNGFEPNPDKVHLQHCSGRQEVTGLTVNKAVNVPRSFVKQIRSMLHAWEQYGEASAEGHFHRSYSKHREPGSNPPSLRRVLHGRLRHLNHIKGRDNTVATALIERARCLAPEFRSIAIAKDAIWIVTDEDNSGRQGTAFSLKGCGIVTCWHALSDTSVLRHSDKTQPAEHAFAIERASKDVDLAILSSSGPTLHEFPFGDDATVKEGDELTLLGFPAWRPGQMLQTLKVTVTGRQTRFGTARIVIDIPVIAGMSGGPALDASGAVVGIVLTGYYGAEGGSTVGNHLQPISVLRDLLTWPQEQASDAPATANSPIAAATVGVQLEEVPLRGTIWSGLFGRFARMLGLRRVS